MKFLRTRYENEHVGGFVTTLACPECDWYHDPRNLLRPTVCPKCGAVAMYTIGRFKLRDKKHGIRGLFAKELEIVDFVRGREHGQKSNQ